MAEQTEPTDRQRSPRRSKWDAPPSEATPSTGSTSTVTSTAAIPAPASKMSNQMFRDMINAGGLSAPEDPAKAYYEAHQKQQVYQLDPNINPLTNTPYTKQYWDIMEKRKTLPCAQAKKDFLKLVKKNQAVVLVGETGSGKTTQMPQFILDAGYASFGKAVACTQPRRVAAMSVAKRVADEMDVELGTFCGYTIRFDDCTSKDTLLKYMTDGMLLRESMNDPMLNRYSVIILDEAHERTLATDVLFGLLKGIMRNRDDLKVIVMSATLDAEKMQGYFGNAPMINIPGRTFPVEIFYTPEPEPNYLTAAIRTVLMIHQEEPAGDILVFLTGEEEIEYACRAIMSGARATLMEHGDLIALPLYSSLPVHLQQRVFEPAPPSLVPGGKPTRKIVVATNVAETSITIDGIVYVVDPGLGKQKVFNPRIKVESLLVAPVSKASASQRSGRAGRTRPGKCFRLFTEESWNTLTDQSFPELLRSELSNTVLQLLKLGVEDLVHFDFLDPPAPETLMHALMHLRHLGALTQDMKLTAMGKLMTEFPLDACGAKAAIMAGRYKCNAEILIIVAMLSVPQIFVRGKEKEMQDAKKAKDAFAHMDGDHLALLNVYQSYERAKLSTADIEGWCKQNYLNYRSLQSAQSVRTQLQAILEKLAIPVVSPLQQGISESNPEYHIQIQKALLTGFFVNVGRYMGGDGKNKDTYYQLKDVHQVAALHPGTCLQHKPEWVVYHDMQHTSKNWIRTVTKIKPEWLWEVCPEYLQGKLPRSTGLQELMEIKTILEQQGMQFPTGGQDEADALLKAAEQQKAAQDFESQRAKQEAYMQQQMMAMQQKQRGITNY